MATRMGKQTRDVLEALTGSHRIRRVEHEGDWTGPWLCGWNDAAGEQTYYGRSQYVWQPVFNSLVRHGWIAEVHRTPGDWVYYGITERGREALSR